MPRMGEVTQTDIDSSITTHKASVSDHQIPSIATGSYTGNNGDDRQITTGFKCSAVLLLGISNTRYAMMIPNRVVDWGGNIKAGGSALHTTDGFIVYETTDTLNRNAEVYDYWAISE